MNQLKILLYLVVSFFGCLHVCAQTDFSIENISQIGLPVVNIITVDGVEPTCDYVTHPEGSMGEGITNNNKVPCRITISKNGEILYDSGEYIKDESGATIKINGNTSAYHNNKPYKLKLEKKADLLFRNDNKYKDKEWRLMKDAVTLKTVIGLKVNELVGLPWTPAYQVCNVFLNNDYRGCYLLIESVKRNSDCRLDVDKKTGYIIERDAYWWNEEKYFCTYYFSSLQLYRWTWKYPDEDDVTEDQENYIREYINSAEKSLETGNYDEYIDVNSFASWLLGHDILGTWDSGGSNLFVIKYDDSSTSLLKMANMWDFDTIFKLEKGSLTRYHQNDFDFYYPLLLHSQNRAFVAAYKKKWEKIRESITQNIKDYILSFVNEQGEALQTSRLYYQERWNKELTTVEQDVQEAFSWFDEHLPLLNSAINEYQDDSDCIEDIHTAHEYESKAFFNIQGQEIIKPSRGIYIKKGKKYILP